MIVLTDGLFAVNTMQKRDMCKSVGPASKGDLNHKLLRKTQKVNRNMTASKKNLTLFDNSEQKTQIKNLHVMTC